MPNSMYFFFNIGNEKYYYYFNNFGNYFYHLFVFK